MGTERRGPVPVKIPSREGKEGFSLQGWVLPFGITYPETPPMEGNPILMLNGAAEAAWQTPLEKGKPRGLEGKSCSKFHLSSRNKGDKHQGGNSC